MVNPFPALDPRTNITTVSRQFHFYVRYTEVHLEGPGYWNGVDFKKLFKLEIL